MFVSAWFECPHAKSHKNHRAAERPGGGPGIPTSFPDNPDPLLQVMAGKRTLGTLPDPGATGQFASSHTS